MKNVFFRRLRSIPALYAVNARIRSAWIKHRYRVWCERYQSASILGNDAKGVWTKAFSLQKNSRITEEKERRFVYLSTSYEQDCAGLIDGLRAHGEVHLLRSADGKPQMQLPAHTRDYEAVRRLNGAALCREVDELSKAGPVSAIIGQMWNFCVPVEVLLAMRKRGIPVVNIAMDDRHSFHRILFGAASDWGVAGLLPALSCALTAAPECVSWYRRHGVDAMFWPEASSPELFGPSGSEKLHDITFVGANYGFRSAVVDALRRAGLHVITRGQGWPEGTIATEDIPEIFSTSRIVLGVGGILHCRDFPALKMRDFDGPMSGSFYLTSYNPDLELCYKLGEEIETWRDEHELVEKAAYFLRNEQRREQIAAAGRRRAAWDHTWEGRFEQMVRFLEVHSL